MKLSNLAMAAAVACGISASNLFADQANDIQLVSCCEEASCDCGEPVCGCEPVCDLGCDSGCDGGCDSACGDSSCCSLLSGLSCCGDCDLGDPFTLFGEHCGWSAGGWVQLGYVSEPNTLFNSLADTVQLQQAWLYAEKAIDTSCGFDLGGRIDYIYGTDGPDTQAFGTDPSGWDNSWDNGGNYGHAIPQLYLEAGYGDLSVKAGHFYTIIGYEVVQAPDNFFYSHAYTMYNSEPFTHTGVLGTYNFSDDVTFYGGWTEGWDSGFDDNGDMFLGGVSLGLTDDLTVTYATTVGRFGEDRFNGVEKGYMQSIVADYNINDKLEYVFQTDLLDSEDAAGVAVRDTFGINQYLFYTINDCLALGTRFEWYQNEGVYTQVGQTADIYELTFGVNYKPHANVIVRPEFRGDWIDNNTANQAAVAADDASSVIADGGDSQFTFGIDTIFTF